MPRPKTKENSFPVPRATARPLKVGAKIYKNLFYKNVEAEIDPNFKNVLRTFLRLRVD